MATMEEVIAKVEEETTQVGGFKVFIQELRDQIKALPTVTPAMQAQIDQVFTMVSSNSKALADAMMVNTPPVA